MLKAVFATALVASMTMGTTAIMTSSSSEAASRRYCDRVATNYANRKAGAKQILGGAAIGAGIGALTGVIVPGLKTGTAAAVGAGAGALAGGVNANSKWRKYYNRAYRDCRAS